MGIDESEVSRLLRGDMPGDDPVWGEVSSFLEDVTTVYPAVPTTALEGRHLAAVARESALARSEHRHRRHGAVRTPARTNRVLAGSLGGALIVLTAGVGVASALGVNSFEQLIRSVVPSVVFPGPTTGSPAAPGDHSTVGEPVTDSPRAQPSSVPNPSASPGPNPASTREPGSVGDENKSNRATEKANNGKPKSPKPTPPKASPTPHRASPTPPGKNKG
jgi:hypothetical protein